MITEDLKRKITLLIKNDRLEDAIQDLIFNLENTNSYKEIILVAAEYKELKTKTRLGIISNQESSLVKNKLRVTLLDILEDKDLKSEISTKSNTKTIKPTTIKDSGFIVLGNAHVTVNASTFIGRDKVIYSKTIKKEDNGE